MVECGTILTISNRQIEVRFCKMNPCSISTETKVTTTITTEISTPPELLYESNWKPKIYYSTSENGKPLSIPEFTGIVSYHQH